MFTTKKDKEKKEQRSKSPHSSRNKSPTKKTPTSMDISGKRGTKKFSESENKLEGWLKKQGKKKEGTNLSKSLWQRRYFQQTSSCKIVYSKNIGGPVLGCFDPTEIISINLKAEPSSDFWAFEVQLPNRVLPLLSGTAEELNYWVTGLGALRQFRGGLASLPPDRERAEQPVFPGIRFHNKEESESKEEGISDTYSEGEVEEGENGDDEWESGTIVEEESNSESNSGSGGGNLSVSPGSKSARASASVGSVTGGGGGGISASGSVSSRISESPDIIRPPRPDRKVPSSPSGEIPARPARKSIQMSRPSFKANAASTTSIPSENDPEFEPSPKTQKRMSVDGKQMRSLQRRGTPPKKCLPPVPQKSLPSPPPSAGHSPLSASCSSPCHSSSSSSSPPPPSPISVSSPEKLDKSDNAEKSEKQKKPEEITVSSSPKDQLLATPSPKTKRKSIGRASSSNRGWVAAPKKEQKHGNLLRMRADGLTSDSNLSRSRSNEVEEKQENKLEKQEIKQEIKQEKQEGGGFDEATEKRNTQKTKVAKEILETEREYVQRLNIIKTYFVEPLEKEAQQPWGLVKTDHIKSLFSNVNVLLNIAEELLKHLEEKMAKWDEKDPDTHIIGDLFVKMAPIFKIYSEYGNNYEKGCLTTLTTLRDFSGEFQLFCERQMNLSALAGLTIDSLLITPIQRIPRYGLLLKDALKYTSEDHVDYSHLEQALVRMKEVADFLNKDIGNEEYRSRFLKLASEGASSLMKPNRRLLYDSEIDVGNKVKIHIFVFNDIVIHIPIEKAKKKSNLLLDQYHWPSSLVWVEDSKDNPNPLSFSLIGPTLRYNVICGNAGDKKTIMTKVNLAINEALSSMEKGATLHKRFGTFTEFQGGGSYKGWWKDGWMDGKGKFIIHDTIYEGMFSEGNMSGEGTMLFGNGSGYTGEWKDNLPWGNGRANIDGGVYEGDWVSGFREGRGKCVYHCGDVYTGGWVAGLPHGVGVLTQTNGLKYEGGFECGKPHGQGTLDCTWGLKYNGFWNGGYMHGRGTLHYANGDTYEGDFQFGFRHGTGKFTGRESVYTGEWDGGLFDGNGRLVRYGDIFDGRFKKGKLSGQATATYIGSSISEYTGEWVNGVYQGKGVLTHRNGDCFKGTFKNGLMHGEGKYSYANGTREEGTWSHGRREGKMLVAGSSPGLVFKGRVFGEALKLTDGGPTGAWNVFLPPSLPQILFHDFCSN